MIGADTFTGPTLGPDWEWNRNLRWPANNCLRLQTAAATNDLGQARNTLTHRMPEQGSAAIGGRALAAIPASATVPGNAPIQLEESM